MTFLTYFLTMSNMENNLRTLINRTAQRLSFPELDESESSRHVCYVDSSGF